MDVEKGGEKPRPQSNDRDVTGQRKHQLNKRQLTELNLRALETGRRILSVPGSDTHRAVPSCSWKRRQPEACPSAASRNGFPSLRSRTEAENHRASSGVAQNSPPPDSGALLDSGASLDSGAPLDSGLWTLDSGPPANCVLVEDGQWSGACSPLFSSTDGKSRRSPWRSCPSGRSLWTFLSCPASKPPRGQQRRRRCGPGEPNSLPKRHRGWMEPKPRQKYSNIRWKTPKHLRRNLGWDVCCRERGDVHIILGPCHLFLCVTFQLFLTVLWNYSIIHFLHVLVLFVLGSHAKGTISSTQTVHEPPCHVSTS